MRSELAWTHISPLPIIIRDKKTNIDLCLWNGVCLTRNYGRLITGTVWCSIYWPNSVKETAWQEYQKAYYANAFLTRKWDSIVENQSAETFLSWITRTVSSKDKEFWIKLKSKYSAFEALSWFEKERLLETEV